MSIKSYFEIFSALPQSVYKGLAFPIWTHVLRCMMILYQLSTHSDPSWDNHATRKVANLVHILQKLVQLTEGAAVEAGEHSENDLFGRFAQFLRNFQVWVNTMFTRGSTSRTAPTSYDSELSRSEVDAMENPSIANLKTMEFGDNIWLGNVFGW